MFSFVGKWTAPRQSSSSCSLQEARADERGFLFGSLWVRSNCLGEGSDINRTRVGNPAQPLAFCRSPRQVCKRGDTRDNQLLISLTIQTIRIYWAWSKPKRHSAFTSPCLAISYT